MHEDIICSFATERVSLLIKRASYNECGVTAVCTKHNGGREMGWDRTFEGRQNSICKATDAWKQLVCLGNATEVFHNINFTLNLPASKTLQYCPLTPKGITKSLQGPAWSGPWLPLGSHLLPHWLSCSSLCPELSTPVIHLPYFFTSVRLLLKSHLISSHQRGPSWPP